MTPALSTGLDASRIVAALVVFVGHARGLAVAPSDIGPGWHRAGEDAVVAFFVISGYVIAWSTARSRVDFRGYMEARASRIYSAAIPALLFALALDHIGMRLDASPYLPNWQYDHILATLVFHWSFLGGTWFGPADPYSVASYWSLPYEVWYYVLFGCLTLLDGRRRRWAVVGVLLFMGPRMWLLLPCWWLGVLLLDWLPRLRMTPIQARLLILAAVCGYAWFIASGARANGDALSRDAFAWFNTWSPLVFRPGGSVHPLSDYVTACLFALLVIGMANSDLRLGTRGEAGVRWLAGYTFTLYLVHYPILVFCTALGLRRVEWLTFLAVTAVTLVATWILGQIGEARRRMYLHAIRRLLDVAQSLRNRHRRPVGKR